MERSPPSGVVRALKVHFLKVFKLGLTFLKLLITFGLSDWLIGLNWL